MRPTWIPRLRLGITANSLLYFLLALVLALPIGAYITWWVAEGQASTDLDREIDETFQVVGADLLRENQDLATLGTWLVKQKDFGALVRTPDNQALTKVLEPLTKTSIVDAVTVTNAQGIVLSRVTEGQPASQGNLVIDEPGVKGALSGQPSNLLMADSPGQLQERLILPVKDEEEQPIGVLILAFNINSDYVKNLAKRTTRDIAIVYDDRFILTSLVGRDDDPWASQLAPSPVIEAERENRLSQLVVLKANSELYLFKFKPLQSTIPFGQGMYGVGLPQAYLDGMRAALFRTFGIGVLAGLVVIGAVGFYSAHVLSGLVRKLSTAARSMAAGDLSTRIDLRRADELGELAEQMEGMRQQLSESLRSSVFEKRRYEAILQSVALPLLVTDQSHCVASVNPAAEALLRQSRRDLSGRLFHELFVIGEKDDGSFPPFWRAERVGAEGAPNLVVRGRFPLRAFPQVVLDITSTPVQVDGKMHGDVHVLQDVSKLEEFSRAQDAFLLNVAHELQGPLSSWHSSIDLLIEDYTTIGLTDLGAMLRGLQRSAIKFERLVENLVDIGRLQAGRFVVRPVPTAIYALIQDTFSQIEPLLQSRGQKLELEMSCTPSAATLADRPRVVEVLINLLKNASKYGPMGQPIVWSIYREEGYLHFEITDNGAGISLADQAHLFTRFYRAKHVEEEGAGIGLGLALAKGIVEAHGGQIGVRSREGAGSTFWFRLPQADPSASN